MNSERRAAARGAGGHRVEGRGATRLGQRAGDFSRSVIERAFESSGLCNLAFFVAVLVLLLPAPAGTSRPRLVPGDRSAGDIVAPRDTEVIDPILTEERRRAARDAAADVYVFDSERGERLVRKLGAVFEAGRAILREERGETAHARVLEALRGVVRDAEAEALYRLGFSVDIERALAGALDRAMDAVVVGNRALLAREPSIVVVRLPGSREETFADFGSVVDLEEARAKVASDVANLAAIPPEERPILSELTQSFIDANLAYDIEATAARREAAAASVPPVVTKIPAGAVLLRAGERVTSESAARVEAALGRPGRRTGLGGAAGLAAVVAFLAFFLQLYARYHQRHHRRVHHLHALLVLVTVGNLALVRGILWLASRVSAGLAPPFNDPRAYAYVVPLAAGSVLIALLSNGRIAMVFSGFNAVLFGGSTGWDGLAMVWGLLVQWTGVYAISAYRERAALLRAGLLVGAGGALAALAVEILRRGAESAGGAWFGAALALVAGAVGSGLVVSFVLPLLEALFNVLTEIRLLELSNVNHPLLSQLAVKAPGSYSHSLVVGTLAEEAAKAIGASTLFCRVAALYHDIGKIRKPEYYVENQRGHNPHDRLSPFMSALVIASHVKDGIRMAREAGVPRQIIDIIPQHHGTRLMTFFYDKARRTADPALGPINEADFRYPGPKPQSREAAIFMLADAVEAAARTVEEPTAGRLGEVIHKVGNAVVLDGQLDECDLSFADLERIEEALLRALMGMYHHRVEYPGFDFGWRHEERPAEPSARRAVRGG